MIFVMVNLNEDSHNLVSVMTDAVAKADDATRFLFLNQTQHTKPCY